MRVLGRLAFLISFGVVFGGCAREGVPGVDTSDFSDTAMRRGPAGLDSGVDVTPTRLDTMPVVPDAGTPEAAPPDTRPAVDTTPATPDTLPPDTGSDLGRDVQPVVPDTRPAVDTTPACPTVMAKLPTSGSGDPSATVTATSTDGFCFQTCDVLTSVMWQRFSGRTVTVNDVPIYLSYAGVVNGDEGSMSPVPSALAGTALRLVRVSAGSSASAAFTWYGFPTPCP